MSGYTFKQAGRRYRQLFWPLMAVYSVVCIGGAFVQRMMDPNPVWLPVLLSVITVLPILFVFTAIWRYTQETDEFTRSRQLEALTIAGMAVVGAVGLVGFLQIYEAIERFDVFWLVPLYFLVYSIGFHLRGGRNCV